MNRSCYKYSNTFRIVFVKDREKEIYIGEKKTIFVHDHTININTKFVVSLARHEIRLQKIMKI